jgi:hypothetical protein
MLKRTHTHSLDRSWSGPSAMNTQTGHVCLGEPGCRPRRITDLSTLDLQLSHGAVASGSRWCTYWGRSGPCVHVRRIPMRCASTLRLLWTCQIGSRPARPTRYIGPSCEGAAAYAARVTPAPNVPTSANAERRPICGWCSKNGGLYGWRGGPERPAKSANPTPYMAAKTRPARAQPLAGKPARRVEAAATPQMTITASVTGRKPAVRKG